MQRMADGRRMFTEEEQRRLLAEHDALPWGAKADWLKKKKLSSALPSYWRKKFGLRENGHEPETETRAALEEQRQRLAAGTQETGNLAGSRVQGLQRELAAARAVIKYLEARIEELS